jgi:adenylate kinase
MLIGLSGTPGCGKTTSAEILRNMGYTVVDLNQYAKNNNCLGDYDKDRDSYEINLEKLNGLVLGDFSDADCIIEGHLSHLLSLNMVIILRCNPLILRKRLEEKGWVEKKIAENIEAEILDVIKVEAHEEDHKIFEIDSSHKTPEQIADTITRIIKGDYESPRIDWLMDYEYLLLKSS